jgi:hypothetical protein
MSTKTTELLKSASIADEALFDMEVIVPAGEHRQFIIELRKQLWQVLAKALASSNI